MADNASFRDGSNALKNRATKEIATDVHLQKTLVTDDTGAALALATAANQAAQTTLLGAAAETAPASDTASSGLNGRLQRIAQRITSMIALLPAALGQGTMAQSLRVVLASDQSAVAVKGGPVSITDYSTTITTGGSAQNTAASNASRRYLHIANPDLTRTIYFSTTGTATVAGAGSTALGPGAAYIWDSATPTGAVSIIGAATGQPFTVKEG